MGRGELKGEGELSRISQGAAGEQSSAAPTREREGEGGKRMKSRQRGRERKEERQLSLRSRRLYSFFGMLDFSVLIAQRARRGLCFVCGFFGGTKHIQGASGGGGGCGEREGGGGGGGCGGRSDR